MTRSTYRILFSLAAMLLILCCISCFIADIGSAEFYVSICSVILNAIMVAFAIFKIRTIKE